MTSTTQSTFAHPETLRDDGEFILYRNRLPSSDGPDTTLVVTSLREHTAPRSLRRIEHEYSLRGDLDPAWSVFPLALSTHHGRSALVLQDPGGEPLERLVGRPMELQQFLRIAIGLAAALGRVHQHGLIHKDVKPANAFVNVATGQVWLTGFGIASRMPRERQPPAPPEFIAGTLAYMAPEQTGRMNRSIDSRSDLYSLGITLYEMLTGTLPFTASDPMECVHAHIARPPVPPGELMKDLPFTVSAIILKLLAKTAEDRYQTAAGVEADLRWCLDELDARGRIEALPLGTHDASDRLLMPEKLYGRDRERETLLAAFEQVVASGTPALVLVSGYSGIGKSSVVHELDKAIVLPRGIFLSGKFDQYKRDIPYATLAQAFGSFTHQILSESETEVERWGRAIRAAVASNGQLIVNLIPELELVIGKQPPVAALPATEAESRFHMVFRSFLGVFAAKEHPLALFLDDLQWLDAATLKLLEHLITHPDLRHLLIVGAYRDNEVSAAHPLMQTLNAIRRTEALVREIVLAPLSLEDVTHFVADTLHCEPAHAAPLARLMHEKTLGNPFFAIQFLTALAEERLVTFEPGVAAWTWDLERIRAKAYSDNVVDLMVGKLRRLSEATQGRLKQLACLGNAAEIATLSRVHGIPEAQIHGALWEAVRAELILRTPGGYAFLHDRVQEAAYGLIPASERPAIHLRIGRLLAAQTPRAKLDDAIFEIVNQLNRGAALIDSQDEREQVAAFNLRAGERAKTSTAYASALSYFASGRALLPDDSWPQRYALLFALEFHRAECEFLSGQMAAAEARLAMLVTRTESLVDSAAVACLRLELYTTLDRSDRGVELCLEYLRRIGVQWSVHPTKAEVRAEYDEIWRRIGSRSVEELVDLPLASDPEWRGTLNVLCQVVTPALFTDINLVCLVLCRMANISLEHGNSDASCFAYVWLGMILGPHFDDYPTAFRFGRLGFELVEQRGLDRFKARVYMSFGNLVSPWTRHIRAGRPLIRRAFSTANELGDLTFAAYSCNNLITNLLAAGEPLPDIQQEAETGLAFARKIRFGLVIDIITSQLRLILTLRGLTPSFNSFNDAQFDEARFEQHFAADSRLALPACWYWIRKLQARFHAGDYASAIEAELHAQRLLWTSPSFLEVAEYRLYGALSRAAYCATVPVEQQPLHLEALRAHHRQLESWAHHCAENFAHLTALVSAEIARLEGQDLAAGRLYEQAIRLARETGFIQHEALANESTARFYLARGFDTIAHAYLRNARYCYLRWGADGKVRQLDELYPELREDPAQRRPAIPIGPSVDYLDLKTIVKVSQAVSREIVLEKLIDTLMRTAIECAGAQRGLLIVQHGGSHRVEAEAVTSREAITVQFRPGSDPAPDLPESILYYVIRTQESVILEDASASNAYSADKYFGRQRVRSVLCLPLIKHASVVGVLYLENNLAAHVFTPARSAVLQVLASQAAIALENAYLYTDLQQENGERRRAEEALRRSEAYLAQAQNLSRTGSFGWNPASGELYWSAETYRIYEFDVADALTLQRAVQRTHPEDKALLERALDHAQREKKDFDLEYRLLMPDGSSKHLQILARAHLDESGNLEFVGAVMDVTPHKRAEEARRAAQADLMHVTRLTTMGELAASIAHEVNQPLTSIVTNAEGCLLWLEKEPPNLDRVRKNAERIIRAGHHAGDVIRSLRALVRKTTPEMRSLDIHEVIREVLSLLRGELQRYAAQLETHFLEGLPRVHADRVLLQQVIVNLVMNGIQAMSAVTGRPRHLHVTTQLDADGMVRIAFADCGTGLDPGRMDRIFEPMFTTKHDGLGMGLPICRSIVDAHGGRLWAAANVPQGAVFQFTLPPSHLAGA